MKVHKIFETPLYLYTNETFLKLNKTCDKYIKQAKEWNKTRIKNRKKFYRKDIGDFGLSHPSTTLLGQPKLKDFEEFVGQTSYNILDSQGFNMSKHRVDFTEMWVQEFGAKGGGHQRNHVHHAHISGFYFLKCNENTSHPVFHDPRPGKIMTDLLMKDSYKINYGSSQVHYKSNPGDFMFFNSYMPHAYVHHKGKDKFRFIHFNLQAVLDPKKSNLNKE